MKDFQLILMVPRNDVGEAVQKLNTLEDIVVQIATDSEPSDFDLNKEHGFYSLDIAELFPLIISISALATSMTTLAKSIIDLRKSKKTDKKIYVIIKHELIPIDNEIDSKHLENIIREKAQEQ